MIVMQKKTLEVLISKLGAEVLFCEQSRVFFLTVSKNDTIRVHNESFLNNLSLLINSISFIPLKRLDLNGYKI